LDNKTKTHYVSLVLHTLYCLTDLERAAVDVWLNRALVPDGDLNLRVRGVAAELVVRVTERLTDCVHADEGAGGKIVLAGDVSLSHRIDLRPLGVGVIWKKLLWVDLVLGVAVRRLLCILERHGRRVQRLKALDCAV